ncbi:TetR/AcrR family transcriptional regulator [Microbacterium sp. NPDC019599]|uniref:TetR/AcrR family transcriptional regulator n=1 Tax=Microbacterium sp. NPDC019599 TaxID=3154690 RepID=UPI0033C8D04C
MNSRRKYDMSNRARSAEQTGKRIVWAMVECFANTPYPAIRLSDVAERAGVTTQTVIRRFGGKAGLMIAAVEAASEGVDELQVPGLGLEEAIEALLSTYVQYGDVMAKMFAEAHLVEGLEPIAARGRAEYLEWLHRSFAPHLTEGLTQGEHARRMARLIAACDVGTWQLLRRDGALDTEEARIAMTELIRGVLAG